MAINQNRNNDKDIKTFDNFLLKIFSSSLNNKSLKNDFFCSTQKDRNRAKYSAGFIVVERSICFCSTVQYRTSSVFLKNKMTINQRRKCDSVVHTTD